jgi:3-deoxy-D-manno-octulosonic-acid transferase
VRYLPIDFRPIVRRVVRAVSPSVFIFVETEIWPSLLSELAESEVPTAMISARISDRSYPGYQRIAPLLRSSLATLDVICARDPISEERLVSLGVPAARTTVVGDMKLDALAPSLVEKTDDLIAELAGVASLQAPILVAASTRRGEEALVLDAFERVLERHGGARLILAPRHPDRFDSVAQLLGDRRHAFVRRSDKHVTTATIESWQVLLLDTVGELRACFKGATAAFVGGSLVPMGGHNVLEPAAFSVPVVVGPHLENIRESVVALAEVGALRVVNDSRELADVWNMWISDPNACRRAGRSGAARVAAGRGAVQEAMEHLEPLLVQRISAKSR